MRRCIKSGLFDRVIIVTDSSEIESVVLDFGGDVVRSQKDHQCGSDRIAEAVFDLDVDIVINVQGDEPFIRPEGLASLIEVFKSDTKKEIDLASLMIPISDEMNNPNVVKVITDLCNRALYFSRSAIPHQHSKETHATVYKHVGVYAFRKSALIDFYEHAPTPWNWLNKSKPFGIWKWEKQFKWSKHNLMVSGLMSLKTWSAPKN